MILPELTSRTIAGVKSPLKTISGKRPSGGKNIIKFLQRHPIISIATAATCLVIALAIYFFVFGPFRKR